MSKKIWLCRLLILFVSMGAFAQINGQIGLGNGWLLGYNESGQVGNRRFNANSFFVMPPKQAPVSTTFVVNSTVVSGDGICDAAECTFMEALTAANASPNTGAVNNHRRHLCA